MRITNNVLLRTTLAGIQDNLRSIQRSTERVASGHWFRRASDDPGIAGTVQRTDSQLEALNQYQSNIGSARSRLMLEETVLGQVTDLLTRARELATREGSSNANTDSRLIAKKEIDQLRQMIVELGNTRFEGLYLFGGAHADRPPLQFDEHGNIVINEIIPASNEVEISAERLAQVNHDAGAIFDESGVVAALDALSAALAADDREGVAASGSLLSDSLDEIQALLGDLGARMIRLDIAEANIDALDVNLRTFRSDMTEVEFEEAMTELIGRQTALQAALVATSRILHTTLTDYL